MPELFVGRDRQVRDRSTGAIVGAVHQVGRVWCAEPLDSDERLQGRTRKDALQALAQHLERLTWPAAGVTVTRTTRRGGKHPREIHWRGTVVAVLKSRVRVRWTEKDGQRTVAVLDCHPDDLTIEEEP